MGVEKRTPPRHCCHRQPCPSQDAVIDPHRRSVSLAFIIVTGSQVLRRTPSSTLTAVTSADQSHLHSSLSPAVRSFAGRRHRPSPPLPALISLTCIHHCHRQSGPSSTMTAIFDSRYYHKPSQLSPAVITDVTGRHPHHCHKRLPSQRTQRSITVTAMPRTTGSRKTNTVHNVLPRVWNASVDMEDIFFTQQYWRFHRHHTSSQSANRPQWK